MPTKDSILCSATFFEKIITFAVCGYFLLIYMQNCMHIAVNQNKSVTFVI